MLERLSSTDRFQEYQTELEVYEWSVLSNILFCYFVMINTLKLPMQEEMPMGKVEVVAIIFHIKCNFNLYFY